MHSCSRSSLRNYKFIPYKVRSVAEENKILHVGVAGSSHRPAVCKADFLLLSVNNAVTKVKASSTLSENSGNPLNITVKNITNNQHR